VYIYIIYTDIISFGNEEEKRRITESSLLLFLFADSSYHLSREKQETLVNLVTDISPKIFEELISGLT
jgi:hypothetical protein